MSDSVTAVSTSTVSSSPERFLGRVKWFNNKAGYGFVTVTDGPKSGSDVFVHHSSIKVESEQYKYLVQGEYVEFYLSDTKTSDHEYQAGGVCGIKGGKLMCETRRDLRVARSQYKTTRPEAESDECEEAPKTPRSVRPPASGSQKPKREQTSQKTQTPDNEWSYVSRAKKAANQESDSQTPVSAPRKPRATRPAGGRGRGGDSR